MSFLAHHCLKCTHSKNVHLGSPQAGFENPVASTGAHKSCECCGLLGQQNNTRDFDPQPTLHETWNFITGLPDDLVQPGALWNADSPAHRMKTCGCDSCHIKYGELVA